MPNINNLSSKTFEKFLVYIGCEFSRTKGDHNIYTKNGMERPIVVPKTNRLPNFVINNNLKLLNLSRNEFEEILKNI